MTNEDKIIFLGDSYTIGEAVEMSQNFPSQLIRKIERASGKKFEPTIIAKTGWTTGELIENIKLKNINDQFDFATLLIGVNNQYRGMDIEIYKRNSNFYCKKQLPMQRMCRMSLSSVFPIGDVHLLQKIVISRKSDKRLMHIIRSIGILHQSRPAITLK